MKFRAHDTFFIRKGWLSKGLKSILTNQYVFMGFDEAGNKVNPMDALGIGANMVKSLRYWLQAVGLTEEVLIAGRKSQQLTTLGKLVHDNDPYIEELGTLCLLHHQLCMNREFVTAWYFFFNEFSLKHFSKDDFLTAITGYIKMNEDDSVSPRSLEDDFNCIIDTYISRERRGSTKTSPENNIDCPFGELELLDIDNKKARTYKKRSAGRNTLPPLVALAIITHQSENERELAISALLNKANSIGRLFNLDTISLSAMLTELENHGYVKVIRTAGLDVVRLTSDLSYLLCIEKYYEAISRG